jgi:hypothetical protein
MADEMWREKITYTPLWSHDDDDGSSEIRGGKRLRLLRFLLAGSYGRSTELAIFSISPGGQCCKHRRKHPVQCKTTARFDGGTGEGRDVELSLLSG